MENEGIPDCYPMIYVPLARHFLSQYTLKYNKPKITLAPEEPDTLRAYSWPGNVRELKNVIERAVLLSANGRLDFSALRPPAFKDAPTVSPKPVQEGRRAVPEFPDDLPSLEEMERRYIQHVVSLTRGKISGPGGASELLGMNRSTLGNRMKKLGLR